MDESRKADSTPPPAPAGTGPGRTVADSTVGAPGPTPAEDKPRHAAPEPEPTGHPRRWFLAGGVATLVAAAGGVGVALLRDDPSPHEAAPPARLTAAISAEQELIADLDATTGGTPAVRRVVVQARADHAAHLSALHAIAAGYGATTATRSTAAGTGGTRSGTPRSAAQLRSAEASAAARAAADAAALDGRLATLFASIAACEASHEELLR